MANIDWLKVFLLRNFRVMKDKKKKRRNYLGDGRHEGQNAAANNRGQCLVVSVTHQ